MKRRTLIHAMGALPLLSTLPVGAATPIHVYKDPTCDCCTGWVKHLSAAGFAVEVTDTADTAAIARERVSPTPSARVIPRLSRATRSRATSPQRRSSASSR
jgi:hypothetical protein